MQNLCVVHGNPSWKAQYISGAISSSGRFSPIRFEKIGTGEKITVEYKGNKWTTENGRKVKKEISESVEIEDNGLYAWAYDLRTQEKVEGPPVTMEMAVKEGWYTKDGSKWKTMPDLMLSYRAISFFGKVHASDITLGLPTADEAIDIEPIEKEEPLKIKFPSKKKKEKPEHPKWFLEHKQIIDICQDKSAAMEYIDDNVRPAKDKGALKTTHWEYIIRYIEEKNFEGNW